MKIILFAAVTIFKNLCYITLIPNFKGYLLFCFSLSLFDLFPEVNRHEAGTDPGPITPLISKHNLPAFVSKKTGLPRENKKTLYIKPSTLCTMCFYDYLMYVMS